MPITPNGEQFANYAKSELTGEVVMLNLLRFKERADHDAGSGAEAYQRYGDAVLKMIEAQGGKLLWLGRSHHVFIGDVGENQWDWVALVSYPSRQAFLEMVSTPRYREIHVDREDGLAETVVIACAPAPAFASAGA